MIYNIQLLRFISALLIVLVHSTTVTRFAGWNQTGESFLRLGTDLFLVTSTFLTALVSSRSPKSGLAFLRDRIARIVPFYWLMTAVVIAAALIAPSHFKGTIVTPDTVWKSLLFVPFVKASGLVQPIIYVAWTLNYLVMFAVIFAAALMIFGRARAIPATCVILSLMVVGGVVAPDGFVPWDFYSAPVVLDMVWGLGAFLVYRELKTPSVALGLFALSAATILLVLRPLFWDFETVWRSIGNGLPCALLLFGALQLEACKIRATGAWLTLLANSTFAIYLSHVFVAPVFNRGAMLLEKWAPWAHWLLLSIEIASAVGVGILLYMLVERPLTARVLEWVRRSRSVSQAAALPDAGKP
jgi:peptidoglycan/LPS O-acetylase OafA/YrhL